MGEPDKALYPPVEPVSAGFKGRCPRCGAGRLFNGYIATAKGCGNCGLDFAFIDAGDGPVPFVIMIVGFIVVGLALWTDISFNPPLWLHFLIWMPLAIFLSLFALRWVKGILIALQYRNKAALGTIDRGGQ
jgi:uncharacterized protein (DUF983 family)